MVTLFVMTQGCGGATAALLTTELLNFIFLIILRMCYSWREGQYASSEHRTNMRKVCGH